MTLPDVYLDFHDKTKHHRNQKQYSEQLITLRNVSNDLQVLEST